MRWLVLILLLLPKMALANNSAVFSNSDFTICAIQDEKVKCWGSNYYGQINVPRLKNPRMVANGNLHTCALDDDGVKCWGDHSTATEVPELKNPRAVYAGNYDTCAVDDDGLKCWGIHLGIVDIPALTDIQDLSAYYSHVCAISGGVLKCWGANDFGQSDVRRISKPKMVSAGDAYTCAIDEIGLSCWGKNDQGQASVPALTNPRDVATGENHTCAIDDYGVHCWGSNTSNQLKVPALKNPVAVAVGRDFSCAIDDTGLVCWGDNDDIKSVPGLKITPSMEHPRFGLDDLTSSLKILTTTSSPVRSSFFKNLSTFSEQSLKVGPKDSQLQKLSTYSASYILLSLLSPSILSGDSDFYLQNIIPAYKKDLAKASADLGVQGLNDIYPDANLKLQTTLKVMQAAVSVMNEFLSVEDRNKTQDVTKSLGVAMANPSRTNISTALTAIQNQQSIFEKLRPSPKTAFLVTTLNTATEWLDKKLR